MAKTAEQILTDFLAWVKALDENRLEELEVDFTDPELISKMGRLRDPVKWAKANEEMQQKARIAALLEIELIQAIDDVLTRAPAPPDVIFYALANVAHHYREQEPKSS